MSEIREIVGMHYSDTEERAEQDEDYQNMSMLKKKYLNAKRKDSD